MFDSKQQLTQRLSNAVDLAIDFATLGEYGLEPVDATSACDDRRTHLQELYSIRTPRSSTTSYSASSCGSRRRLARENGPRQSLARAVS